MSEANEFIPMDKLARVYRKIRAAMTEQTREYDAKMESLKADLTEVTNAIRDQMKSLGSKSLKTTEGHIIMSTKTRYDALDWEAFRDFVIENNALELLERRIAQTAMRQFLEDNPGLVPRGLNATSEITVTVRKV